MPAPPPPLLPYPAQAQAFPLLYSLLSLFLVLSQAAGRPVLTSVELNSNGLVAVTISGGVLIGRE